MRQTRLPLKTRLYARIQKTDYCWLWTGTTLQNGYGKTTIDGRQVLAHRASWIVHNGVIPEGLFVCHTCDNRRCVNPEHLFLGTSTDNNWDMAAKGRNVGHQPGEKHPCAKLTEDQAVRILRRLRSGESGNSIAKEFGLNRHSIYELRDGKTWKHLKR